MTAWVKGRESALLFAVFVLLAAMMHQRIRQMLITTLCYGVACLALRDMFQSKAAVLPPAYDYVFMEKGRMIALLLVALLAATAGLTETLRPGTTLARRLYFGASSLYFSGLGVLELRLARNLAVPPAVRHRRCGFFRLYLCGSDRGGGRGRGGRRTAGR